MLTTLTRDFVLCSRPFDLAARLGDRGIGLDAAGWNTVMDGLAGATSVTALNGVNGLGGLFAGGQTRAVLDGRDLEDKEAVVATARLLRRNEATLKTLDLRCPSFSPLSVQTSG